MVENKSTPTNVVNTVTGSVPADELGVVLISETLLSVYPGAEFAPEIDLDKSKIFDALKTKLNNFKRAGGKTIVDTSGMFHGRDARLYENLSRSTGVHIVLSTGLGPEKLLSGYFLTPQKNPPTPWSAEQFSALFIKEVEEGVVVPRVFRVAPAGIVTSIADETGITELEVNLFHAAALTTLKTGIPTSVQYGKDAVAELEVILETGVNADRIIIGGLDRIDAVNAKAAFEVAKRGANVSIDHIGWTPSEGFIGDADRAELVKELVDAGYTEQILLSSSAVGVAKGHEAKEHEYDYVLTTFVPLLKKAGVTAEQVATILEKNPQNVLTVKNAQVEKELVKANISNEE